MTLAPGFLPHDYGFDTDQTCKRCGATYYQVADRLKPEECQPISGDLDPQLVTEAFEVNRQAVNIAWLALRDAVRRQYDTWAESSAETRRLREVAKQISGLGNDDANNEVVCGYRGSQAVVVQPHRRPHDAMVVLPRPNPMMPAWAAWINDARELIEIVEKTAQPTARGVPFDNGPP